MVVLTALPTPFIVGVVVENTPGRAAQSVQACFQEGADAVELNLPPLKKTSSLLFSGGPVYTSYRRSAFMAVYGKAFTDLPPLSDEERMHLQIEALDKGSAGLDIEADTFAPSADEWTSQRTAIQRQLAVVEQARRRGRTIIFSWHPPRKLTFAEARKKASLLHERGADFVKIVERVKSTSEALNSLAISVVLKEELDFPFVFLALGEPAVRFRPLMTHFGNSYALCRAKKGANQLPAQPLITKVKALHAALF